MISIKAKGNVIVGQIVCAHCGRTIQIRSQTEEDVTNFMERSGWVNVGLETYCDNICARKGVRQQRAA